MSLPNLDKIYKNKNVFPKRENIFNWKILNPKVVILGQDPYHQRGQANGLAFAVSLNTPIPPSLRNIFKELKDDIGTFKTDRTLLHWKEEGVLLLNASLTVEESKPGSHIHIWKEYIFNLVKELGQRKNIVWILWGKKAQEYKKIIKGYFITSPHPSPFSAHKGFLGSKPFSKTNNYLLKLNLKPIDW